MARSRGVVVLAAIGLLFASTVVCAAAASPLSSLPMNDDSNGTYYNNVSSADFQACSQQDVERMVHDAVQATRAQDVQVTAGLLRIFFHDCFPQGCDASILLDNGERRDDNILPQNKGLQPRALQLIEDIRRRVHSQCGPTVSCADILALATRDAVHLAGGRHFSMPLGRRDSLAPAQDWEVRSLPRPDDAVNTLINSFRSRELNEVDLVALSGAHTVGRARCSSFEDRTKNPKDGFAWGLRGFCNGDKNRQHNLDVTTPDKFDNKYFADLKEKKGVLTSDQVLADGPTKWLVDGFAGDEGWFFGQFADSMIKLSKTKWRKEHDGEIRHNSCFRTNSGRINLNTDVDADAGDEGLAAAA